MTGKSAPRITAAIVDYGLGNLFSIRRACEHVGIKAVVTAQKEDIAHTDLVILPGVGAFGDAMATLHRLDLVEVLRDVAGSGKPLVGICLGIQLLMSESYEFGVHKGLGLIEGPVVRFQDPREQNRPLKVPQVQWNQIFRNSTLRYDGDPWSGTPLAELADGEFMYFVHSFFAQPVDPSAVLSVSRYGQFEFCSSLRWRNVFACQFHPERSGSAGLKIYHNIVRWVHAARGEGAV